MRAGGVRGDARGGLAEGYHAPEGIVDKKKGGTGEIGMLWTRLQQLTGLYTLEVLAIRTEAERG